MNALQDWWQGLSGRERVLVACGGAAVMLALLYVLVMEPLGERRQLLARQYAAERMQAAELGRWAEEAAALRAAAPGAAPGLSTPLIVALNEAIAAHGLKTALRRLVPANEREAQLAFEGVVFDKLLEFVIVLHAQYGLEVVRINVERSGAPGIVSANLSVGRG
ncbi:MAG: type II secretion system protein M [Gammaproteobacteria bacterium]|nr:type II secretion system protein M [Gammaproteobacteria bacterium]MBI5614715.1 type II secretion system protein M [Gammaproteobacteria bacterium]